MLQKEHIRSDHLLTQEARERDDAKSSIANSLRALKQLTTDSLILTI